MSIIEHNYMNRCKRRRKFYQAMTRRALKEKRFFTFKNSWPFPVFAALAAYCVVVVLTGCAAVPTGLKKDGDGKRPQIEQSLRAEASRWEGTPHRFGGTGRGGIDCSGLVVRLYKKIFNIRLPRTTNDQVKAGTSISPGQIKAGDLVFFLPPDKIRHVGVYLGEGEFVHASSSKGVIISTIDDPYWRDIFWTARRIF